MKTDLEKIVKELNWTDPNQESEPEDFALVVDTLNLQWGFETEVFCQKDSIMSDGIKVRDIDRAHFKTSNAEYAFPGGQGLDILKRMKRPLVRKNIVDHVIKNDKRHLKYARWFEIIKDPDFNPDLGEYEAYLKRHKELWDQVNRGEITWFDFNRETSDAIQIKDKFYLSAVELPSFIRMHQENRKP